MKSLDELRDEHEGIKLMLDIMLAITQQVETNGEIDISHVDQLMEFITVFVDKCHHGKEEDLLFPALVEMGVMNANGPIGTMLTEHEEGRTYVRMMLKSLNEYKNGDKQSLEEFSRIARQYISMLQAHIDKENNVLYPIGEKLLSDNSDVQLVEGFERIEREQIGEGKHEQFHRMLHSLKSYYL